ncbi:hypothetical protein [Proteus mirabilis]|uniref:hypothetical protein n=1 Tax=Proteus mirabilis TaxID=584 RepID=UPI0029E405E2|nr:hypothetical protein [Proteus mirabilis]HEJ9436503.1 hypothetical protein [Proteus mirabilis]
MKFSFEQLKQIQSIERNNYLTQVKQDFFYHYGDKIKDLETMSERLSQAFDYLLSLGFQDEKLIRAFLYTEACYPGFQKIKKIKAMLEENNRIPEQQYKDYLRICIKRLQWGD